MSENAKRYYKKIISYTSLAEKQAAYRKFFVSTDNLLVYKDEVDEELISNGYQNVIVTT